jgi:hypothetical protein
VGADRGLLSLGHFHLHRFDTDNMSCDGPTVNLSVITKA